MVLESERETESRSRWQSQEGHCYPFDDCRSGVYLVWCHFKLSLTVVVLPTCCLLVAVEMSYCLQFAATVLLPPGRKDLRMLLRACRKDVRMLL